MPIQSLHKTTPPLSIDEPVAATKPRRRSLFWWKISGSLVGVMIVLAAVIGYRILAAVNTTTNDNKKVSVLTQLTHLVSNGDAQLRGEAEDRVNILLLGIGGQGHEGPLLTDTMILASVKPSTGQVSLLSIPRDLYVAIPKNGYRKINAANALGYDMDYPGGGEQLTVDIVSSITGQPIQYFGRIDFAGFKKIIDDLGGIDVNVQTAFSDYEYPNNTFGYQTISFKTGEQKMTGDLALKFARSRHGNNGEGSDFARSKRQQLVLEGVRTKALSVGTILNPVKIGSVLSSLGSHTRTNMEVWELLRLSKMVGNASGDEIANRVIDSTPEGPLKNTTGLDGAFLLEPKAGFQNFTAIKAIAADMFDLKAMKSEAATITVIDATGKAGTGKTMADILATIGYPEAGVVTAKGGATSESTSVIDQTGGMKPATLRTLKSYFNIPVGSTGLTPLDYQSFVDSNINAVRSANDNKNAALIPSANTSDIVIVLGKDVLTNQLAKVKATNT